MQPYDFFGPVPWGPREGPKGQISLNFNYKVNLKGFKPNFMCLLYNISDENFIQSPGLGLGGTRVGV